MAPPQKSLYDRLGGQPAITAVVDDFVGNVAADNRINGFFAKTTSGKVTMMVDHSTASNNGASGARADGALAKLVLSNSVVSGNDTGVSTANGGALLSYQDNRIDLNGTDGWPVTSLALH